MRATRAVAMAVGLACACAGGPALASVAGRSPHYGGGPTPTLPLTSTLTTTTTTTTTTTQTTPVPNLRVCLKVEPAIIARRLHVRVSAVRVKQRVGSNSMPQCNYLVPHARAGGPHRRVVVVVNVDNGPQAGWRLMRKVVEAGQIWGPIPPGWKPPLGLSGLGPYASWFSNIDQLMVNNVSRKYLLTVSIVWPRAKRAEMIELARAAVTPYRRMRSFVA